MDMYMYLLHRDQIKKQKNGRHKKIKKSSPSISAESSLLVSCSVPPNVLYSIKGGEGGV